MFRRLLDAPAMQTAELASLRVAVAGAAPCPWELTSEWQQRTAVRILRGYGMTELFRPISYTAGDTRELPDAVGRPVPGVEVRIADDAGTPLPRGAEGELWVRSPGVMDGYLNAPAETREVLRDGWFVTGDLGVLTDDGHVRLVGRKRERILRGGYSVAPAEVEAVLRAHPAVEDAAVGGRPHADLGEEVAAFVTLRAGHDSSADELLAHCRRRLAPFKCPRELHIVPNLPRSATGKILKSRLIEG
jgi:long-chain acyl-CoA synthetase